MGEKCCTLVIDEALPKGLAANTASCLSITLGQRRPEIIAPDLPDQAERHHAGLVNITVPILGASRDWITAKRNQLFESCPDSLEIIDFSEQAQIAKTFEEYRNALAHYPAGKLRYLGIALYGSEKQVRRHTKNLPLLR